jgi:hypothetical protein
MTAAAPVSSAKCGKSRSGSPPAQVAGGEPQRVRMRPIDHGDELDAVAPPEPAVPIDLDRRPGAATLRRVDPPRDDGDPRRAMADQEPAILPPHLGRPRARRAAAPQASRGR